MVSDLVIKLRVLVAGHWFTRLFKKRGGAKN